jgi:hypothetical protein
LGSHESGAGQISKNASGRVVGRAVLHARVISCAFTFGTSSCMRQPVSFVQAVQPLCSVQIV